MSLSIHFSKDINSEHSTVILPILEGERLPHGLVDQELQDFITRAIGLNPKFKARHGDILDLILPENFDSERLILLGFGKAEDLTTLQAQDAGGKLCAYMTGKGLVVASFIGTGESFISEEYAACVAAGFQLRSYKFDRYKSADKEDDSLPDFEALEIVHDNAARAQALFKPHDYVSQGVFQARDLVNMPPNDLYPEAYAKIIKDELKPLGVEVEIFDAKKMAKMEMGGILAVGQGSDRPPCMVVMRWNGAGKKPKDEQAPLVFVGKGVTFDTGGISIKPSAGMDEMKMDMGGSAAVVGLMKALALRAAQADVIGVVGLAENMPSARAYRPGDIITTYAGKTIEVMNTDAEGRLVLADCLTYVQKTYKPRFIIDLATLTGAVIVALGHQYCGTFSTDDTLWKQMDHASAETGEKLWRMPLDDFWQDQMKSDVADLRNTSKTKGGGSCTAAGFLQHFIEGDVPWVHMDIAGTAWTKTDQPTVPKCASGFGVRVLNALVASYYEG